MSLRSLLRWLRRSLSSLLLGLLLVGLGFWGHFLLNGPELKPWHLASWTKNSLRRPMRAAP